jgi:alkylation response protein AidB-like acyl-CoA dehydrogenase
MRFALSPEQVELGHVIGTWCEHAAKSAPLRDLHAADQGALDRLWAEAAGYGWLGVAVPGSGGSLLDACLIAEQFASHLIPLPYAGNAILAASAATVFGSPAQRERIYAALSSGSERFSVVVDEELRWPGRGARGYAWEWLPGTAPVDLRDGALEFLDAGQARQADCEDRQRFIGRLEAGAASQEPLDGQANRFRAAAMVATSAVLVGYMQGALRSAVEHARRRTQFGRPIASFQAIQHLCAELLIDVEAGRTATYGAAWSVENLTVAEGLNAAAVAKAWTAPAAVRVCQSALQIFGGMGFTWDCDAHMYLRSALVCANSFATEAAALDVVADLALFAPPGPGDGGGGHE